MQWSGYGLIMGVDDFDHKYKMVNVISERGRWKGLAPVSKGYISLFSQALCMWKGKTEESLGEWDFSNIMHLPYHSNFHKNQTDEKHYCTYLTCIYICQLINLYVPERFMCQETFAMLLEVKELLAKFQWKEAWVECEAYLSYVEKESSDFFQKAWDNLLAQYQVQPSKVIRSALLSKI